MLLGVLAAVVLWSKSNSISTLQTKPGKSIDKDAYSRIIEEGLEGSGVRYEFAPESIRYQDAADIARAGLDKYLKGDITDFKELLPDYMREAEAEQKLKAGELPISRLPKQE